MNTQQPLPQTETPAAAGITIVGNKSYMQDAKGALVPLGLVKPVDKLMDETVRHMIAFARELSGQIARFKGHCFDDIGSLQALIAQDYGAGIGGSRGNITLTSFDGLLKVQVQAADVLEFGPELQAAKRLVDQCLAEWSEGSRDELKAIVTRAFQVDKEGRINRAELFMLMRADIADPRWKNAVAAIRDSIRVIGSKTYIRFHERAGTGEPWRGISIDLAQA